MKAASIILGLAILPAIATAGISEMREAELRNFVVQDCGSCHGLTFKGGLGPPLRPENLAGKPKDFLVMTILDGRPHTAMPPWKALLTGEEAGWIVDRLMTGTVEEN